MAKKQTNPTPPKMPNVVSSKNEVRSFRNGDEVRKHCPGCSTSDLLVPMNPKTSEYSINVTYRCPRCGHVEQVAKEEILRAITPERFRNKDVDSLINDGNDVAGRAAKRQPEGTTPFDARP